MDSRGLEFIFRTFQGADPTGPAELKPLSEPAHADRRDAAPHGDPKFPSLFVSLQIDPRGPSDFVPLVDLGVHLFASELPVMREIGSQAPVTAASRRVFRHSKRLDEDSHAQVVAGFAGFGREDKYPFFPCLLEKFAV